jgi:hypothetical protein
VYLVRPDDTAHIVGVFHGAMGLDDYLRSFSPCSRRPRAVGEVVVDRSLPQAQDAEHVLRPEGAGTIDREYCA